MVRDLTFKQFLTALERNNFARPVLFWVQDKENPRHSYGMIITAKGKILKRATIAHLLASRAADAKKDSAHAG